MALSTLDERTALVLIDLQSGVLAAPTEPYPAAEVLLRASGLAEAFRARDLPVVLVRVTAATDGSDWPAGRTDHGGRPGGWPQGWDVLADELTGHPQDVVVTKRNPGAFHGTDLDLQLRRRGVTQIVLGGISTTGGVEATARAGYEHGYHVSLVTDVMADRDAESHRNSVAKILPKVGETGTAAELLALLGTTHG